MRLNRIWLGIGLLVGMMSAAVVYAKTTSQILQAVYDSTHTAIRINQVTP